MRFEVPQFIEIEDKIIGPLTWKQFVYLAGSGGLLVVLFLSVPLIIFGMLGIPLAALGISLAFQKVNNRPFSIFLESCVNYLTKDKLYLWRKDAVQTIIEKDETITSTVSPLTFANRKSINSLSRKLELHIPEQ